MSLILFPNKSSAFKEFKPSSNSHTDILSSSSNSAASAAKVVQLSLQHFIPSNDPHVQLERLYDAINLILSGKSTVESYQQLSSTCRRLVLSPHSLGPDIHARIRDEMTKSTERLAREWRGSIMSREGGWLDRLVQGWTTWRKNTGLLSGVFVYLDRIYSTDNSGVSSTEHLALEAFRENIWDNELLFEKTREDILSWVTAERKAEQPNVSLRSTIKHVIELASSLGTSDSIYEPYTAQTVTHYAIVTETHISMVQSGSMSATKYVNWVNDKVNEELDRCNVCLRSDVGQMSVHIVHQETVAKVASHLVHRAVDEAMDSSDLEDLTRVYRLCGLVNVMSLFIKALRENIESRVRTVISDPAKDPEMIDNVLKIKRFADRAVETLFVVTPNPQENTVTDTGIEVDVDDVQDGGEKLDVNSSRATGHDRVIQLELEEAVRIGFKAGLGSRQNAPAEWIAKHLDAAMRRGQGSGTEAQFNSLLDEIIALVGYTRDKDVFRAFYATGLAKRLLLNKSASDDMERNMIVKLQAEMGDEFTSGDVMMKDLQLSETLVKAYHSARGRNPEQFKDHSDLAAYVLTESAWPSYPQLKDGWDFKLTPELQSSIDSFSAWYGTQHQNRKLSWRHQLATVTISARFDSGKYEIGVSLFQSVVLLQFNETDVLDFNELKQRTGIESSELIRTLQSLSLGRKGTRVLVKRPAGKDVGPTDKFSFNKAFTSDRIKFKINQIQQDLSVEESRQTNEQVAIDRVSVLEATIVRIMKGRKTMTLQLLIDAVVSEVSKRFPPDVREIKKRMESLIEREFIMRDEEDRNVLHYLA